MPRARPALRKAAWALFSDGVTGHPLPGSTSLPLVQPCKPGALHSSPLRPCGCLGAAAQTIGSTSFLLKDKLLQSLRRPDTYLNEAGDSPKSPARPHSWDSAACVADGWAKGLFKSIWGCGGDPAGWQEAFYQGRSLLAPMAFPPFLLSVV